MLFDLVGCKFYFYEYVNVCSVADLRLLFSDLYPTWGFITNPDQTLEIVSDPDPDHCRIKLRILESFKIQQYCLKI